MFRLLQPQRYLFEPELVRKLVPGVVHISLLIKLLLHVHRVGFAVDHSQELVLAVLKLAGQGGLEVVELGDDVGLAIVEGILHLFEVHFCFELGYEVGFGLKQFDCGRFVADLSPYHFELAEDSSVLSLLLCL